MDGEDYWMLVGVLLSCQEIYSTVRNENPFFQLGLFGERAGTSFRCLNAHTGRSRGLMWHFLSASLQIKKELIPATQNQAACHRLSSCVDGLSSCAEVGRVRDSGLTHVMLNGI